MKPSGVAGRDTIEQIGNPRAESIADNDSNDDHSKLELLFTSPCSCGNEKLIR